MIVVYQSTTHDVIPVTLTGENSSGQTITLPSSGYMLALVPVERVPVDADFVAPVATASGAGTGMPINLPAVGAYLLWARIVSAAPLQPQFPIATVAIRPGQ